MKEARAIIKALLLDVEKIELSLHKSASNLFFRGLEHEYVLNYLKEKDIEPNNTIKRTTGLEEFWNEENTVVEAYQQFQLPEEYEYLNDIKKIFQKVNSNDLKAKEALERIKRFPNDYETIFDFELLKIKIDITKQIIKLNELLDEPVPEVNRIKEVQDKQYITVNDFELIYGYGKESQKKFRMLKEKIKGTDKYKDNAWPLPVFSGRGNKILYDRKEVEKWFARREVMMRTE